MARKKSTSGANGKGKPRAKAKRTKKARTKRSFIGRTIYWLVVLGLWTGIAGAAAGALATTVRGAVPAMPRRSAVDALIAAN